MSPILLKSALVAFSSLIASFFLAFTMVPALGGDIDGNAWLLLTICPLMLAWPASAFGLWQADRLKNANGELARAHAELAEAHRLLEEKSSRDDMTGMLKREHFFAALDHSRRRTDRGALLIIDADHFKKINDSFGHPTGDAALLEIAAAIARSIRNCDVLGRIGGEEFGAFLAGASGEEAKSVAERIRREVELIRFHPGDEDAMPLTVSIGGITCAPDATVSELMRAADKRLYRAKHLGRNLAILDDRIAA
ncbi:MAG: hypothetical protein K0S21_297 [Rhizobiaceae bacterium]|nr:hypothetical protein [Rhizobiaceae bacterium]